MIFGLNCHPLVIELNAWCDLQKTVIKKKKMLHKSIHNLPLPVGNLSASEHHTVHSQ